MTEVHQIPRRLFLGTSAGANNLVFQDENGVGVHVYQASHLRMVRYPMGDSIGVEETGAILLGLPGVPTIVLSASLMEGETLLVERRQPLTQDLNLGPGRNYDSSDIESQLDYLVRSDQDNAGRIGVVEDFFPLDASKVAAPSGLNGFLYDTGENLIYLSGTGTPGASAYAVWLAKGNIGTEQDFIDSLTGPKGDPGPKGPQGGVEGLLSGPNWRQMIDGTVAMEGQVLVVSGAASVVLPQALASADYKITFGQYEKGWIPFVSNKTTAGFTVGGLDYGADDVLLDWHIMGGQL